jgi:hypothetical protein
MVLSSTPDTPLMLPIVPSRRVIMLTRVTLALCLLVGVTSTASAQKDAPHGLDHFECYWVTPSNVFPAPMQLRDQFDVARDLVTSVMDLRIGRFCNPVEKIVEGRPTSPISNPAAHLTIFQLPPQPIVLRQVWLRNQFGNQQLALRDAFALAVPTGAEAIVEGSEPVASLPIPKGLDHFKCYNASGRRIETKVTLHDRFHFTSARVLDPIAFCNPVEKTRPNTANGTEAEVTPIANAKAHLTCYTITLRPWTGRLTVLITNQFGSGHLAVGQPDVLCVPSEKLRWYELTPVPPRG